MNGYLEALARQARAVGPPAPEPPPASPDPAAPESMPEQVGPPQHTWVGEVEEVRAVRPAGRTAPAAPAAALDGAARPRAVPAPRQAATASADGDDDGHPDASTHRSRRATGPCHPSTPVRDPAATTRAEASDGPGHATPELPHRASTTAGSTTPGSVIPSPVVDEAPPPKRPGQAAAPEEADPLHPPRARRSSWGETVQQVAAWVASGDEPRTPTGPAPAPAAAPESPARFSVQEPLQARRPPIPPGRMPRSADLEREEHLHLSIGAIEVVVEEPPTPRPRPVAPSDPPPARGGGASRDLSRHYLAREW